MKKLPSFLFSLILLSCASPQIEKEKVVQKDLDSLFNPLKKGPQVVSSSQAPSVKTPSQEVVSPQEKASQDLEKTASSPQKEKQDPDSQKKEEHKKKLSSQKPEEQALFSEVEKTWDSYLGNIQAGEQLVYSARFIGLKAGTLLLQVMPEKEENRHHFYARADSASYFAFIYGFKNYLHSYVDKQTFLPTRFELVQKETKKEVNDLEIFSANPPEVTVYYKRVKKKKNKEYTRKRTLPQRYLDPISTLYFIRGLPLAVGKKWELPVTNKGKLYHLTLSVEAYKKRKVLGEMQMSYHLQLSLYKVSEPKDIDTGRIWITEKKRIPFSYEFDLRVGKIKLNLLRTHTVKEKNLDE